MLIFQSQSQLQQDQNQASSTQQQNDESNNGAIIPSLDFEYELSMAEIASYCSITGNFCAESEHFECFK